MTGISGYILKVDIYMKLNDTKPWKAGINLNTSDSFMKGIILYKHATFYFK